MERKSNKTKKIFFATALFFLAISQTFSYEKPLVTDIKAEYATGRKINILWTLPENLNFPITQLLIYRSTIPIATSDDLKKAVPLGQIDGHSTGYTDIVDDFKDYFYAVLAYTDQLHDFIMPSMNATVKGVRIKAKQPATQKPRPETEQKRYPSGTLRETPLPYLDLIEGMNEKEEKISAEAKNSVKNLGVKNKKDTEMLEPFYFEEDLISPDSGDAYLLFQILSQYFVQRKYNDSVLQFLRLIGTNISTEIEDRATFYLGEAYYFTGEFEKAVRTFIKVEQKFPVQTKKWIKSSLDQLEI